MVSTSTTAIGPGSCEVGMTLSPLGQGLQDRQTTQFSRGRWFGVTSRKTVMPPVRYSAWFGTDATAFGRPPPDDICGSW
ncbi:MAG: hypothetical protein RMJ19_02175 [Gemmatales bacterium]|nr:hypothetical protein [Gemmatales bacterium]MDW8174454.1 hypothetical protein [Gemmatales bacterium]